MMRTSALVLVAVLLVGGGAAQFQPLETDWSDHIAREDLSPAGSLDGAQRIVRFVQASDIHILDDDAPAPIRVGPGDALFAGTGISEGAERPQEEYTDEVLNAMISAINDVHANDALDFVLNTGDNIDNELENELMRFIDNWEGTVTTRTPITGLACQPDGPSANVEDDSGDVTESCTSLPIAVAANNIPLAPGLPWYSAFGNHDGLIQGNVAPAPTFDEAAAQFGRYFLRQTDYVDMHFANNEACMDGAPAGSLSDDFGHGYAFAGERLCDDDVENNGYYAFSMRGIHFVVLDTINDSAGTASDGTSGNDPEGTAGFDGASGLSEGAIDPEQFAWMLMQIDEHPTELIMVLSHHTVNTMFNVFYEKRCDGTCPATTPSESGYVTSHEIMAALADRANVVAWLGGHSHANRVEAKTSNGPSPGFWNIETSSLIDLPQEARVVELWVTANGSQGFLALSSFTHDYEPSRALAATDEQLDPEWAAGRPEDRDVLLWFDMPPGVRLEAQTALPNGMVISVLTPARNNGTHGTIGVPVGIEVGVVDRLLGRPLNGLQLNITINRGDTTAGEVLVATGNMNSTANGQYRFDFVPDLGRVHFARIEATDPSGALPLATKFVSFDIQGVEAPAKNSPLAVPLIPAALLISGLVQRRVALARTQTAAR